MTIKTKTPTRGGTAQIWPGSTGARLRREANTPWPEQERFEAALLRAEALSVGTGSADALMTSSGRR